MARLFEMENDRVEKQNQVKGMITSIAIHGILIILFFFLTGVTPPIPAWDSGGVEINFGYMDVAPVLPQAVKPTTPEKSTGDKIISQENSDVIVNSKKKDDNKKKKTTVVPVTPTDKKTEEKKQEQPKAVFKGWTNTNSSSEGDGTHPGDKGQTNGTPTGTNYSGTPGINGGPGGYGKGINYNLTGRKMMKEPSLKNNSQETGIVVVKIKVNKQGKVISADGPAQGSTTTSTYLLNLAKQASLAAQFDVNSAAMDEQFGTITYNFKAK